MLRYISLSANSFCLINQPTKAVSTGDVFLKISPKLRESTTAWKVSKYGDFSGPYFPAFVLNTERYFVFLRIQSEYRKIRTRKKSVLGHFSRSAPVSESFFHKVAVPRSHVFSCYFCKVFKNIFFIEHPGRQFLNRNFFVQVRTHQICKYGNWYV